MTVTI
jgi:hypothetical protein